MNLNQNVRFFRYGWISSGLSLALMLLMSGLLTGCDDDDVTPAPQLAQASSWIEVYEKRTCDAAGTGLGSCPAEDGFHVDTEGEVAIGPENGPVDAAGTLTVTESNAVILAANAVNDQNLASLPLLCEVWVPTPDEQGVVVKLRDENQLLWTVFQKSESQLRLCYRGDRDLAEALYQAVDPLLDLYGVTPEPTPTPTPSPTPTPTPSPSPTPTTSPTPTPTGTVTILPS